ncbi:MAG: hypothetical protein Alpg2KO_12660 [Alphaproteobacteria bacterium]
MRQKSQTGQHKEPPPLGMAGRGFQFNPVVSFDKLMAGMVNDVVADDVRMMTVIHPPGGSV